MARLQQILELTPKSELVFTGPFTEVSTSYLTLFNPSENYIAFKVKTTAPNYYCVRPNSGLIPPNTSREVAVMLQPMENTSNLEQERAKHKFMIQSAFASENENLSLFWKNTPQENIMDSKLKVKFTPSEKSELASRIFQSNNSQTSTQNSIKHNDNPGDGQAMVDGNVNSESAELQNIIHKMEKENKGLLEQIAQLKERLMTSQTGAMTTCEGLPSAQVALFCLLTFIIGIILGKLF
uniref:Major sperm protein n=1 Tax=Strongyloides papillosus TaxID=174720 RepID=A0A0N5BTC7_STREA